MFKSIPGNTRMAMVVFVFGAFATVACLFVANAQRPKPFEPWNVPMQHQISVLEQAAHPHGTSMPTNRPLRRNQYSEPAVAPCFIQKVMGRRGILFLRIYSSLCSTDRTLPSGSVNQAISGPWPILLPRAISSSPFMSG